MTAIFVTVACLVTVQIPPRVLADEAPAAPSWTTGSFGVRSEAGLANELVYRTGGLMLFHGGPGRSGDVILLQ